MCLLSAFSAIGRMSTAMSAGVSGRVGIRWLAEIGCREASEGEVAAPTAAASMSCADDDEAAPKTEAS